MSHGIYFYRLGFVIILLGMVVMLAACTEQKKKTEETMPEQTVETKIETKSNPATIIIEDSSN